MKVKKFTETRIITSKLPSNKEIDLITNLSFKFNSQDIKSLYFKRWEIEKKYHTLKNKMKFESIKIKTYKYIMRINENIAIGIFKEQFIAIFIESSIKTRKLKLASLQKCIENYIVPVRKLLSKDRKYNITNKYKNNQKYSF